MLKLALESIVESALKLVIVLNRPTLVLSLTLILKAASALVLLNSARLSNSLLIPP